MHRCGGKLRPACAKASAGRQAGRQKGRGLGGKEFLPACFPPKAEWGGTFLKFVMVDLRGFEPLTPCLQSRCSNQLSYRPVFIFHPQSLARKLLK